MSAARAAVVIVSFNTRDELLRGLASLEAVTVPIEVAVVDNASADGSADAVAGRFPNVHVLRNAVNAGFGAACNRGVAETTAPFVLFLNSDAELRPGCLEALLALMEARPRLGAAGPRTLEEDGAVQVSFGPDLTPLNEWRQRRLVHGVKRRLPSALRASAAAAAREHSPAWVSGACLLARRAALEEVHGFDEGFFLYEEDVDLCRRLRGSGWEVLFTPAAEAVHHLGRSVARDPARARFEYHRSHLHFYAKHNGPLARLALRTHVALTGLAGWMAALGPGAGRRARRADAARLLRLAALGQKAPSR